MFFNSVVYISDSAANIVSLTFATSDLVYDILSKTYSVLRGGTVCSIAYSLITLPLNYLS